MRESITEYDGYIIKTPYIGRELTEDEEKERIMKLEEAKKRAKEMIKNL